MHDLLREYDDLTQPHWDVLDLGCGTGLCGELVRSASRWLTGVDLADKMLEVAAQKHIFDELIQSDIIAFLQDKKDKYDLVIAGDVLVYFGDLTPIFKAVYEALRSDGLFIFNAEINEDNDYIMTDSGRFSHRKQYLDQLIAHSQFKLISYQVARMRTQNQLPVQGHLYLLQKTII